MMSSSTEIERRSELAIAPTQTSFTEVQVAALRHLGLQGQDADNNEIQFSDADLGVFFHQCQRTGLDPFARQIYMIMRSEFGRPKPTIQTGIDGFRKIGRDAARRHGATVSKKAPVWFDDEGNEYRVWTKNEPPAAAMVNIVVDGEDNEALLNYRDFVQRKRDGKPNSQWASRPAHMLQKCAEAAAWRIAFPSDFSGIVSSDEPLHVIDEDGNRVAPPAKAQHSTGRGVAGLETALGASNSGAKPEPAQVVDAEPGSQTGGPTAEPGGGVTTAQHEAITEGLNKLFAPGVAGRAKYVRAAIKRDVENLRQLTAAEADELLLVIAEHTAQQAEDDARDKEEAGADDTNFN